MQIGGVDVHPEMSFLLDAKAAIPVTDDPEELRKGWVDYARRLWLPYPADMQVRDTLLDCPGAGVAGRIPVRLYRPGAAPRQSPVVIYLHGGGFTKGDLESGDTIAWGIAERTGFAVVSVDYRLAPEHKFPAALEDCYAVVKHLNQHGPSLGMDPDRIAVWGDSAGGNLAAAVCLVARDRGGPRIAGQALNYATLTNDLSAPAFTQFADAPITTQSVVDSWVHYLPGGRIDDAGWAAPLRAPDLTGLPPAHVHAAEIDCLADDSTAYAARLKAAGNDCVLRIAQGMIHGYLRVRFAGPQTETEFNAPCDFLKARLLALEPG